MIDKKTFLKEKKNGGEKLINNERSVNDKFFERMEARRKQSDLPLDEYVEDLRPRVEKNAIYASEKKRINAYILIVLYDILQELRK